MVAKEKGTQGGGAAEKGAWISYLIIIIFSAILIGLGLFFIFTPFWPLGVLFLLGEVFSLYRARAVYKAVSKQNR